MTRNLKIAPNLSLPLEVVTQKLAWLGTTSSGKTYGASKMAELLYHAGAQIIVLDPVGVWYGLRLGKDGESPSGVKMPIFGGLHGDVPLEATAGKLLADLVVDRTLSCIIDVSQLESDAEKVRFARAFAERFFFRKKAASSAVHLFIEECQEFVPQNPQKDEPQMLHAFTRLQKLGRNFGIGSSLISQRPQEVNKKALNMAQTLFVFRTTGTHERAAIEKWIEDKALDEDIAGDLPKIPTGHCHVWSPEFLKISEMAHILPKETCDTSATPEVGEGAVTRHLAPIDLKQIASDMAATIEKAKADDPKELRKKIAELQKLAVMKSPAVQQVGVSVEQYDELRWENKGLRIELSDFKRRLRSLSKEIVGYADMAEKSVNSIRRAVLTDGALLAADDGSSRATNGATLSRTPTPIPKREPDTNRRDIPRDKPSAMSSSNGLGKAERSILSVLAQYPNGRTIRQVAILAGYSGKGGGFRNAVSALRTRGYVEGKDMIQITSTGQNSGIAWEELPQGEDLFRHWMSQLGKAERHILQRRCTTHGRTR